MRNDDDLIIDYVRGLASDESRRLVEESPELLKRVGPLRMMLSGELPEVPSQYLLRAECIPEEGGSPTFTAVWVTLTRRQPMAQGLRSSGQGSTWHADLGEGSFGLSLPSEADPDRVALGRLSFKDDRQPSDFYLDPLDGTRIQFSSAGALEFEILSPLKTLRLIDERSKAIYILSFEES